MQLLWGALVLGAAIRFWLVFRTFGTNDMIAWQDFVGAVREFGVVGVYSHREAYNHPPLVSLYLSALPRWAESVPNGLAALIRLPASLADLGSALLAYRLVAHFWDRRRALFSAVLVALSPVLILISGFHGNSDPVFLLCLLVAAERWLIGRQPWVSGLALGLAMNIKIVPVLAVPLFFFFLPDLRQRVKFSLGILVSLALGYGYVLSVDPGELLSSVFAYTGNRGQWGAGLLLKQVWDNYPLVEPLFKGAIFASIAILTFRLGQRAHQSHDHWEQGRLFLQGLGWTFLLFFVFTPGFGIQYLAWLVPTTLFIEFRRALQLNLLAGLLCFSAYNNWCNGDWSKPAYSGPWNPWEFFLGIALWVFLIQWARRQIRKALGGRSSAA